MLGKRLVAHKRAVLPAIHTMVRQRGPKLQRERRRMMQQNPLCAGYPSGFHGVVVVPWTQRDHIVPLWKGGRDVPENTQGLCDDCHVRKSADEAKERHFIK